MGGYVIHYDKIKIISLERSGMNGESQGEISAYRAKEASWLASERASKCYVCLRQNEDTVGGKGENISSFAGIYTTSSSSVVYVH